MITDNFSILTPAYGRDYKTKAAAEKDFRDGKDFIRHTFTGHTQYCAIGDFQPGVSVKLRFGRNAKFHVIKV